MIQQLTIHSRGAGLTDFTRDVNDVVASSQVDEGLCTIFLKHTSASLIIQENADPDVQLDLENFFARLVPENDPMYRHTAEGPDDMPAHIKTALTSNSLSIPIFNQRLVLGTWQGIYLWEHRRHSTHRQVVVHVGG